MFWHTHRHTHTKKLWWWWREIFLGNICYEKDDDEEIVKLIFE